MPNVMQYIIYEKNRTYIGKSFSEYFKINGVEVKQYVDYYVEPIFIGYESAGRYNVFKNFS